MPASPDPEVLMQENNISPDDEAKDPFAIGNIRKAWDNLVAGGYPHTGPMPEANHVYIRFLPVNESELEILKSDSSLVLFDYPLNSEQPEGEFLTPSDGTSSLTQYCVVHAGKRLPGINYEVIYEVFIPDNERVSKSSDSGIKLFYDELIYESARITGNLPVEDSIISPVAKSSRKWTPRGRIRVWDDLLGMFIPVPHANVHARWFTHVETALTDEEGNFQTGEFKYKVNYSIKWENSLFTIRDGLFFQAWYNGPKMKGDWMLDIRSGKSKMFATIHRAAFKNFYGDNLGLSRPILYSGGRTKICYMERNGTGRFNGDFSAGGLLPDIQIWGNGNRRATHLIFGTVCHELGHQLHSQLVGNIKFIRTSKLIRESWAEVVEWALTNDEYNTKGKKYGVWSAAKYDHQYNKHTCWPNVYDKDYSPIFIDLVDKVNQRESNGPDHPNDMISQYSVAFLNQRVLKNAEDVKSLKEQISINKLEEVDDYKIGELFHMY